MRLLTLDLERYGHFSDKRLVFRPDACLHIVHGPNEAGKSCSLAAVTDLLFGIERSTRYDWLHPAKELRIAATLRSRDGAELRFRRRKNKPALTDLSDAPLPDEALLPVIGGLSREVFRRAFGLDAEALRKSADDLKESGGELGAALFSAASGLRGVGEVKAALEREADAIFAERKSKDRTFYQALARHEAARKALRDSETRAGDLKALREQSAAHERRRQEIRERRAEIASERAGLARLKRTTPVIRGIDDEETMLRTLGDLPASPHGLGAKLLAAIAQASSAEQALREADARRDRYTADMEAMPIDDVLIDAAEDVARLTAESGAYRKARADLPGVDRELEAAARELANLAARLGLPAADLLARQPDDASRALVSELLSRGRALELKAEAAIADREAQRGALARKKQERGQRNPLRDPRPVRERRAALAGLVRLATQMAEIAPAIDNDATTLERDGLRLDPPVRDLARLEQAGLPGRDAIEAAASGLAAVDTAMRNAQQALDIAQAECDTLQAVLDELAAGGVVPTPELIAAVRAERDAHWASLTPALFRDRTALSGGALQSAVAGFERAKQEADRLADAAAHDAQRVAAHADATRRLGRASAASSASRGLLDELAARRDKALADWRGRWSGTGIEPASPHAMTAWRLRVEAMLERLAKLDERRADLARLHDRLENAQVSFDALVADLGLAPSPGLPIPALAERIDAEIDRLARDWDEARDFDTLLADLESRVAASEAAEAEAANALGAWRTAFRAALPRLGLPAEATPAEAEAVLAAWKEVPDKVARHDALVRRIAGMKRDSRLFEEAVAALVGAVAPDLAGQEAEAALRTVIQRLTAAREAKARRGEAQARLTEAAEAADAASAVATRAAEQVEILAAAAGAQRDGELEALAARLADRDSLVDALRARREELARTADGIDEETLRAALADWDPDAAASRLAALEDEDRELDHAGDDASALIKGAKDTLVALETAVGAEIALQQRRNAEAEMLEAAREWAVLSLGAAMLGAAVARRRLGRQEPVMARAGALFALLTGRSFQGLGQSYDDDDVPRLIGHRADGAECAVPAMSEGTRDQLYLALRLAYVEDYACRSEPPPFIGDDLFSTFDDARTANGLRALAAIGDTVQPILFTHHGFVVEAARHELGDRVDVIELG
jgi:uncharacterized protein YhaN